MARADLLAELVRFGMDGDRTKFLKTAESIAAEERAKNHTVLAERLENLLRAFSNGKVNGAVKGGGVVLEQKISGLLHEILPEKSFGDLVLPSDVQAVMREFVQEHHRMELLRSYSLEPRNRLLFIGPPGNGKTSLAEAVAHALLIPLFVIRYDGVIGAYLGETANRLNRVLEFIRTRRCVLFFDEFETLGKERGDRNETGEIKRIVSSLLMQIDDLPSHVVVAAATNHPELLDRAVWRRFQVRVKLPAPNRDTLTEWFAKFAEHIKIPLGYAPRALAEKMNGASFAEVEEFGRSVYRQHVLCIPDSDMKKIVKQNLQSWETRMAKTNPEKVAKAKPKPAAKAKPKKATKAKPKAAKAKPKKTAKAKPKTVKARSKKSKKKARK